MGYVFVLFFQFGMGQYENGPAMLAQNLIIFKFFLYKNSPFVAEAVLALHSIFTAQNKWYFFII